MGRLDNRATGASVVAFAQGGEESVFNHRLGGGFQSANQRGGNAVTRHVCQRVEDGCSELHVLVSREREQYLQRAFALDLREGRGGGGLHVDRVSVIGGAEKSDAEFGGFLRFARLGQAAGVQKRPFVKAGFIVRAGAALAGFGEQFLDRHVAQIGQRPERGRANGLVVAGGGFANFIGGGAGAEHAQRLDDRHAPRAGRRWERFPQRFDRRGRPDALQRRGGVKRDLLVCEQRGERGDGFIVANFLQAVDQEGFNLPIRRSVQAFSQRHSQRRAIRLASLAADMSPQGTDRVARLRVVLFVRAQRHEPFAKVFQRRRPARDQLGGQGSFSGRVLYGNLGDELRDRFGIARSCHQREGQQGGYQFHIRSRKANAS